MDLFRQTVFFSAKKFDRVAIIKTKSATIRFFSSPPFFLLSFSFSKCDFEASRDQKNLPFET